METSDSKYKHKPSEKHTLEEVLKSLQDLIRNDLAEGATKPETGGVRTVDGEGSEARSAREKASYPREDFAPISPAAGPVNLDAVMRSLKDLIGNELDVGDEPKPASTPAASKHDEYLSTADDIEEYLPQEFAPLENESASGTETETALTPPEPEAGMPESSGEEVSLELNEFDNPAATVSQEAIKEDVAPGTQRELFFDDPLPPETKTEAITPEPPGEPAEPAMPETSASEEIPPSAMEAADNMDASLPTIEVEENFDSSAYSEMTDVAPENPPPETEEIVALDVGIADEPAAPPPEMEPSESPAAEAMASIALEIVDEPDSAGKLVTDFDALDIAEAPAETGAPAFTVEPEAEPPRETAPEAETGIEVEAPPPVEAPAAAESSFSLDDIPVLNEVVAPPAGSTLPAGSSASPAESLPSPDRAREIVVRAVAKLNIEMRKSGSAGLDTRTILRLQQLIRQELEKIGEK